MNRQTFRIAFYLILFSQQIFIEQCISEKNYFPLQVGNKWYFQTIPYVENFSMIWGITDTVTINNLKYYILNEIPFRQDGSGSIWKYINGKDVLYLNFNTKQDTVYTCLFSLDTSYVYKYMNQRISTPIQNFSDCIIFKFDIIPDAVDDEYGYTFAPNIGPIQYWNSMNPYELYAAEINGKIITDIKTKDDSHPFFQLNQNYPNPFNSSTQIIFSLQKSGKVDIKIYNLMGQHIDTIIDQFMVLGNYSIPWSPLNIPSGDYFIRLNADNHSQTRLCSYIK